MNSIIKFCKTAHATQQLIIIYQNEATNYNKKCIILIIHEQFDSNDLFVFLGNSNCFNGNSVGFYKGETHPLNSSGQERNDFKTFGGNSEHYDKLATLL